MKCQRVLVVEDEASMREVYRAFFEKRLAPEFEAVIVSDAEQALEVLGEKAVDIVVLDWGLPGISGAHLAKALRADSKTRALGILMVTAKASLGAEIVALESGVDDHIAKPFDENILQARLRSLSRRRERNFARHQTDLFPGIETDWNAGHITIDGLPVHLTPKEIDLLQIFMQRPNIIHTYSYLWQTLWGYDADNWEHILAATVSTLRKKIGPKWGPRLLAHSGRGYAFKP